MDQALELADRLLKMGKLNDARQVLESFLKDNRNHIGAWKLYADAWPAMEDKKRMWSYCLRFNPGNQQALQAVAAMEPVSFAVKPVSTPAPMPNNRKTSRSVSWMLFGGPALFAVLVLIGALYVLNSRPEDPAPYRHEQPVEYY